jgi:nucleoside-diphosphate-sugar epimerase
LRVLVLGGTRFIGRAAVRALVAADHDVTLFHRGQTGADFAPELRRILGDRNDLDTHARSFAELRPEVVLDDLAMNEASALAVVKAFRGLASRLVTLSSCDVYRAYGRFIRSEPGPPDPVPLDESAPLREQLYPFRGQGGDADGYDKIPVERAVLGDAELAGTILRLPAVYGPHDSQHRLFSFLRRILDERPAIPLERGQAQWRFCRGYVEDVGRAIALAVGDARAAGRIYNVAELEAHSEAEWARRIGAVCGWRGEVVELPDGALPGNPFSSSDTAQHLAIDSGAIRRDLAYAETVDPDEALRRTIAWERENPPPGFDPARLDYAAEDALLEAHGG